MFIVTDSMVGCTESHVDCDTRVTTLTAGLPSWPADGLCRSSCQRCACSVSLRYTMSVDLMNLYGWLGVNSGHTGAMYNVKDMNNFDFVYIR